MYIQVLIFGYIPENKVHLSLTGYWQRLLIIKKYA